MITIYHRQLPLSNHASWISPVPQDRGMESHIAAIALQKLVSRSDVTTMHAVRMENTSPALQDEAGNGRG